MGGIVAADTLLSILDDEPIRKKPTSPASSSSSSSPTSPPSRSLSLDPRKRRDSTSASKPPLSRSSTAESKIRDSTSASKPPLSRSSTAESRSRTSESRSRTSESRTRTSESRTRTSESRTRTSESRSRTSESRSRTSESRTRTSEPRARASSSKPSSSRRHDVLNDERMMFPAIIGICAFDTPYLGLSPSMFANSAESNFRAASDAFTTVSSIAKTLGFFGSQETPAQATSSSGSRAAALPEATSSGGGGWGWGKLALAAAAATTVTAGAGTAVYMNRSNITQGFSWVTSHLEFVGVLFKPEELKTRVARTSSVPGVGIANFYTVLGKGAKAVSNTQGKTVEVGGGGLRTFCSLPPKPRSKSTSSTSPTSPISPGGKAPAPAGSAAASSDNRAAADIDVGGQDWRTWWFTQLNDKASDEVNAHMYMFKMATNPAYSDMVDGAGKQIMRWSINWYDSRG
ncbi:hypothetical protein TWF481_001001 [Arthrobotrys musiformis]